ncbi:MAG: isoamylase early set domain-containing protein [Gemmatimonadales bacterium]
MPDNHDADRDDEIQDELLRRVVAELRRPVRLDPAADARALETIRQSGRRRPVNRSGAWGLGAALAAGLLLAVLIGTPHGEPDGRAPGLAAKSGTRAVLLRLAAPSSSQVAVVGDFNDWDPAATPLRPTGDKGVWTVELHLKPGRYHYTFLIDGRRWENDPSEPRAAESDFGAPMSVLTVS